MANNTGELTAFAADVDGGVDALRWSYGLRPHWNGNQATSIILLQFEGRVTFLREGESSPCMGLDARWVDRERTTCIVTEQTAPYQFTFVTPLHHGALDRLETVRDGARMWARVEGAFLVGFIGERNSADWSYRHTQHPSPPLITMGNPWLRVRSEPFELRREDWGDILGQLRPTGFTVLELQLPEVVTRVDGVSDRVARAEAHFHAGRWEECVADLFKTIEALLDHRPALLAAYDERLAGLVQQQASRVKGVCNEARHHPVSAHLDRPLTQHLLLSTKSLLAVYAGAIARAESRQE